MFYFLATTCGRNLPCSGIEPMPSALGARNYNHGTTRGVPSLLFINRIFLKCSFVHSFYLFVVKMLICIHSVQFSSVQSLSRVRLLQPHGLQHARPPCFITNSRSLLKLTSTESVMPSNHLILCRPSPPAFNLSQHRDLFK